MIWIILATTAWAAAPAAQPQTEDAVIAPASPAQPGPVSASLSVGVDAVTLTMASDRTGAVRIELEGAEASTVLEVDTVWGTCVTGDACAAVDIEPGTPALFSTTWTFNAPSLGGITKVTVYDPAGSLVASW